MEIKFSLAKKTEILRLLKFFKENDKVENKFIKNRIEYYIKNHFIALAKKDKKIIGHLFFQGKENPRLGVGEFETVHIHKNYRGKGVGKRLLEKSIIFSKKYFAKKKIKLRCLYLMTRSNNLAAIEVYKKFGFKKQNKIGKIFKDNEPEEIIMTLFF